MPKRTILKDKEGEKGGLVTLNNGGMNKVKRVTGFFPFFFFSLFVYAHTCVHTYQET